MSWKKVSLDSVARVLNGYAFKSSEYVDKGIRVIRITNVQKGVIVDENPKFVDLKRAEEFKKYEIKEGDILVSLTGNVGRAGVLKKEHQPAVLNQRVGLLRITSKDIHPEFLFVLLNSDTFEQEAISNSNGVAQLNLSSKWIESYKIPLPHINDQIRIATLLSRVEALIATRKNNLQQLDDFLKSTFLEMFGPKNTEFNNWPLVEIKTLAEEHKGAMRTGPFGSNLKHGEFSESGDVAVLGIDNAVQNRFLWSEKRYITKEKYEELKRYTIYPDDVIVTIMGTIGRSAVIPKDIPLAINTKHLAAITLNKKIANPHFISFSIHSSPYILSQLKSKTRGAIMSGLNLGIIKETKLRRPPIELQNQFGEMILKVEFIKLEYQANLIELENLYGTLSQKAFKGELDLSRIPLPEVEPKVHSVTLTDQITVTDNVSQLVEYPMSDPIEREKFLRRLFDQFLVEHKNKKLSLDDFWQHANFKTLDSMDEFDKPWNVDDYEQLKGWLFELIKEGKLEQSFLEDSKQIELTVKG